jgi:uncharacterized iron-regulated protein
MLSAFLIVLVLMSSCLSGANRQIIRIRDGRHTSFQNMVEEISSARAIFIGEQHDIPAHHKTELDVIQALHAKGRPLAIGLEMFRKEDQDVLDAWVSGRMPEKDFVPVFLENWGYGWDLYRDIFLYARKEKISLIGLNIPREITRKVGRTGFLSLSDEERKQLPPGITCELDERYMEQLIQVFRFKVAHGKSFDHFCEAQVLWDQAMAWYLSQYVHDNPDRTVVVLAGSIHAWKYGIPRQWQRYTSEEQKVIMTDLPGPHDQINADEADYLVLH